MFIVRSMHWWYSAGWIWAWRRFIVRRVEWCTSMFSMRTLLFTLFAPFKQTYAGSGRGSLDTIIRAFFDRLISRVIGFMIRSVLLLIGGFASILAFVSGLVLMALWAVVPLTPALGIGLFISGFSA